jgi:hypothetical protein
MQYYALATRFLTIKNWGALPPRFGQCTPTYVLGLWGQFLAIANFLLSENIIMINNILLFPF